MEISMENTDSTSATCVEKGMYKKVDNCESDNELVVDDTGLLDVGNIQENVPEGRRIVDLPFILSDNECQKSEKVITPDMTDSEINMKNIDSTSTINMEKIDSTSTTCMAERMYEKVDNCENDNKLIIDNTGMDVGRLQENLPEGRRIVDLRFILREERRVYSNHKAGIDCPFEAWIPVKFHSRGLLTQVFYKCQMCHFETSILSEPIEPDTIDINTTAVAGTITVGTGYAQLQEQCAAMNIPSMSEPYYIKHRDILVDEFQKTALENMKKVGETEKKLAIERNDIINGIPYIPVITDGS